ncbi:MAG: hypothetical protein MRY83_22945 [Flavobacteriales bacterium]|nr:hypothetical protein [Flavobacteriales bacterium]
MDEDIIKFLIVIIFLVVGAINRANKKKRKISNPPPVQNESPQEDLKKVLDELLGRNTPKAPEPKPKAPSKLDTVEDAIDQYEGEGVSVTKASDLHSKKRKLKPEPKAAELDVEDEVAFNARQAFIHSEIFNRKY